VIDFTAWELDLMICADANEAAINLINVEYMDTTEKAQFKLDVQFQELAEKHETILNNMGDYVSKLSVLVEAPLIREMETKESWRYQPEKIFLKGVQIWQWKFLIQLCVKFMEFK
jgi:hypothetical protein